MLIFPFFQSSCLDVLHFSFVFVFASVVFHFFICSCLEFSHFLFLVFVKQSVTLF